MMDAVSHFQIRILMHLSLLIYKCINRQLTKAQMKMQHIPFFILKSNLIISVKFGIIHFVQHVQSIAENIFMFILQEEGGFTCCSFPLWKWFQ